MDHILHRLSRHRRILAALCAGASVALVMHAFSSGTGAEVLVAAKDLPDGHVLTAGDLTRARYESPVHAEHQLNDSSAVGQQLAGSIRKGEPLTDTRVLDGATIPPGQAQFSVEIPRAVLPPLDRGHSVDVMAVDSVKNKPVTLSRGARVMSIKQHQDVVQLTLIAERDAAAQITAASLTSAITVLPVAME